MRICVIRFEERPEMDEATKAAINEACISEKAFDEKGELLWWRDIMADVDKLPLISYKVIKPIWQPPTNPLGLDTNTAGRQIPVNTKVNVSVPGLGLLLLNEVKVVCDYCTDSLMGEMKEGWRIVAVCPQPDQRRPDYVLGRVKSDEE